MKTPIQRKPPKFTDAERYKRFLDMAAKVEASDNPDDLELVVKKVAHASSSEYSKGSRRKAER